MGSEGRSMILPCILSSALVIMDANIAKIAQSKAGHPALWMLLLAHPQI